MRLKEEIIREIKETQIEYDKLIDEIGPLYAFEQHTNHNLIETALSNKIKAFQMIEKQLKMLEIELENK